MSGNNPVFLALLLISEGCSIPSKDSGAAEPGASSGRVEIVAEVLSPDLAVIRPGGTVLFVNMDNKEHHLVSGEPGLSSAGAVFDSNVILGASGFQPFTQFSVTIADDVSYYCALHPLSETGRVRVQR